MEYKTTKGLKVSKKVSEQVIGQDDALNLVKKAARQRRNLILIGEPGTGKSLLGQALAELLPFERLKDILAFPNPADENVPIIKTMSMGEGRKLVAKLRLQGMGSLRNTNMVLIIIALIVTMLPYYFYKNKIFPFDEPVVFASSMITGMVFILAIMLFLNLSKRMRTAGSKIQIPRLIVDNTGKKKAPFVDGTGAHAGALLGDVLHDPLQSGGLGTPAFERLVPGLIHRANGGVLFIDEIGNMPLQTQQELLTALQEKKYPLTGQSERSSGAMVRSEPVPTDFVFVAAGTMETIKHLHPALRSRIRGYGYEVYLNLHMDDTKENRDKIAQFVAQEVVKDGKIPHFTAEAVDEVITEARKRAGMSGKLTMRLRELGGLVRAAGDLALEEEGAKITERKHVLKAKGLARTLEQQIADRYIEDKKRYEVIITKGEKVGRVNGLAVIGSESAYSGILLPIESEVTLGGKKTEFVATGKLGEIAKEAVKNVSAIILKYFGEDIKERYDIFIQFLQTYEGGVEGDSASIAVATAIISALKNIPVRQDTAMTGSLSVRGEVLAVGGVTAKVEAAIDAGISRVIIPKVNEKDIIISNEKLKNVRLIPVTTIKEVLRYALDWKGKEKILARIMKH